MLASTHQKLTHATARSTTRTNIRGAFRRLPARICGGTDVLDLPVPITHISCNLADCDFLSSIASKTACKMSRPGAMQAAVTTSHWPGNSSVPGTEPPKPGISLPDRSSCQSRTAWAAAVVLTSELLESRSAAPVATKANEAPSPDMYSCSGTRTGSAILATRGRLLGFTPNGLAPAPEACLADTTALPTRRNSMYSSVCRRSCSRARLPASERDA